MDSASLLPLLGAGSLAASSLKAGNVFLATADPKTLMTIRGGLTSAVKGMGGKIVKHAPFVAAKGALIPVMAPVMLFTTVSSVIMCARLDKAQRTLGRLSEVVERIRRLLDAEDYARFETAAEQIDEIRSEFEHCRRFASDMPDRLSRIGHDVSLLRSKYGLLIAGEVHSEGDAKSVVSGLNRFFLASVYDIQTDVLQLYLALQDDPHVVEFRHSRLQEKIERYVEDFRQVLHADPVGVFHRRLKANLNLATSMWSYFPRWRPLFRGELATRMQTVRASRKDFNSAQARIERWVAEYEAATDESRQHSIIIYYEADGERALRAYHTRDIQLGPAGM